jgi:hypothetical protein
MACSRLASSRKEKGQNQPNLLLLNKGYKFTPSKQPTKHSVPKCCNAHLSKKRKKYVSEQVAFALWQNVFHIALSVRKFLAKTKVPAYTIWPFLMSHSLNGLILNNARHSSNCHIIAESTVTKLFPVMLQDLTHISKGAKSELMFTVKAAKFTTGENVLLARCVK